MNCQKCSSERICRVSAKCSDMCFVGIKDAEHEGYVPDDVGVGAGDYVAFNFCLDCGQMRGKFPLPVSAMEKDISDAEVLEFYENYFTEGERIEYPFTFRAQLINTAKCYCDKFHIFMNGFLDENHGSPYKMVSAQTFLSMYRKNNAIID